jgi:hypothetical protein
MDLKGVLRVQDTRRNELEAEEVAEEGRCSVLVVVVAVEVLDQAVIHIDMERNYMTGKNYSEKMIVEVGVLGHLNKVMDVAVAVAVVVE